MKKSFIIKDAVQTDYNNKPLYYYSADKWGQSKFFAYHYDNITDAEFRISEIIKEQNGAYEIVTIYQ